PGLLNMHMAQAELAASPELGALPPPHDETVTQIRITVAIRLAAFFLRIAASPVYRLNSQKRLYADRCHKNWCHRRCARPALFDVQLAKLKLRRSQHLVDRENWPRFWRGGNSLNVASNCRTKAAAGSIRNA